jgi:hypothetical protein
LIISIADFACWIAEYVLSFEGSRSNSLTYEESEGALSLTIDVDPGSMNSTLRFANRQSAIVPFEDVIEGMKELAEAFRSDLLVRVPDALSWADLSLLATI